MNDESYVYSEQMLALQLVNEVISGLWQDSAAWPWLQELMGQTHLNSVNNKVPILKINKVG